jgi:hypothetical protein
MKNGNQKKFIPIIILFVFLNGLIFFFRSLLGDNGFNINFLLISNLLLFVLSLTGFIVQGRAIRSLNPQKFVRGVYTSMMIKMFICMIAVLIYLVMNKENINKPALFSSMVIYIFYTIIEVSGLMKAARKNTNA